MMMTRFLKSAKTWNPAIWVGASVLITTFAVNQPILFPVFILWVILSFYVTIKR